MAGKIKRLAPFHFGRVLLHEKFMILMQAQFLARLLIFTGISPLSLLYAAMLIGYLGLIRTGQRSLSPTINRLRLASNIVVMNICFQSIRYIIPALGKEPLDEYLVQVDRFLVGGDLSLMAQQFYHPLLTEIMSLGYMLFIAFLTFTFLLYTLKADLEKLFRFCLAIFMIYAIGIIGYSLVPAQGPCVFFAGDYTFEMEGYFLTRLNQLMVTNGSSVYDVFPSLHVGVGLFLLLFYKKEDAALFRIYLIPFVLLVLSTIYLRYHYSIDLICGSILTVVSIKVAEMNYKKVRGNLKGAEICT